MGKDADNPITPSSIDFSHPLYLHPSDTQAVTLVSQVLRGSENYEVWSRSMRLALFARNKLGLIDGTCLRENQDEKLRGLWDRCNAIVLSWLVNSVDRQLATGIVFSSSARSVWLDLKERFHKADGVRIFSIHKAITSLKQGALSIPEYFTKLRDLWDEYDSLAPLPTCQCPTTQEYAKLVQQQRLLQFLSGLNDNYHHAKTQILLQSPLPTVNQAYSLICQDESHQLISYSTPAHPTEGATMVARGGRQGRGRGRGRSQEECSHCHRKGHKRENCYHLVGFPPSFRRQQAQVSTADHTINTSSSPAQTPITQQQYDQILKLLQKEKDDIAVTTTECIEETISGHLSWQNKEDW
ncbi:uncharacterized protein LOC114729258 [Neltuma alba]|uniref:uncharacterized protein LOC114729258 n=1 Tax=Neltuma alba TaxID=207710 RepID=UPI0010A3DD25|nr:uncharacterized protein LOC114729258 [Prosopis alba]